MRELTTTDQLGSNPIMRETNVIRLAEVRLLQRKIAIHKDALATMEEGSRYHTAIAEYVRGMEGQLEALTNMLAIEDIYKNESAPDCVPDAGLFFEECYYIVAQASRTLAASLSFKEESHPHFALLSGLSSDVSSFLTAMWKTLKAHGGVKSSYHDEINEAILNQLLRRKETDTPKEATVIKEDEPNLPDWQVSLIQETKDLRRDLNNLTKLVRRNCRNIRQL